MRMTLLFDLGNTRLKCARLDDGALHDQVAFAHADTDFEAQVDAWLQRAVDRGRASAWLVSVAGSEIASQVRSLIARRVLPVHAIGTPQDALGLRLGYPDPARFGADRWLALLGARRDQRGPVLVASVGSALTIDAVRGDGQHLGGLIAAPPEAMRAALVARAPRLAIDGGNVQRFATNTADAIVGASVLGACALIERSAAELAQRDGSDVQLVLTGGGAAPLRPWLMPHQWRPDLVFEGLALWVEQHRG
jgi:type III pantothenate kinase